MINIKNEEQQSKKRAKELWDKKIIDTIETGTTKGLQEIHKYLFQDLFPFAGEIRKVNLSKGNFRFASVLFLTQNLKIIEQMPEETYEQIIEKYVEMNIAHPFREGNGRATRIWLDQMLKKNIKKCIDWSKIDKRDYLEAMERSPVNTLEVKTLLKEALTDDINNKQVYLQGIQQSYYYENLSEYNMNDI